MTVPSASTPAAPAVASRPPARRRALLIVAAVIGVAGLAGLALWLLRGGGPGGAPEDWLPGDAVAFVSIRSADLWKSDTVRKTLASLEKGDFADRMEAATGLRPEAVERVTAVFASDDLGVWWAVAETAGPEGVARLRAKLAVPRDVWASGRRYVKGAVRGEEWCVHFAGPTLVVVANEKGMKKALAGVGARQAGPLDDGLARLSEGAHLTAAFVPQGRARQLMRWLVKIPGREGLAPLAEMKEASAVVTFAEQAEAEVALSLPGDGQARVARGACEAAVKLIRTSLGKTKKAGRIDAAAAGVVDKALGEVSYEPAGGRLAMRIRAPVAEAITAAARLTAGTPRPKPAGGKK
jgi:hypothetical protein